MCRYAYHIYKHHYACFRCRKMFRKPRRHELAVPIAEDATRIVPCPQCGVAMANMGMDFKAPRQTDVKQWRKAELLYAHGFNFSSCGCNGPGPRPAALREVPSFLVEQEAHKRETVRQARIAERAQTLSQKRSQDARRRRNIRMAKMIVKVAAASEGAPPCA
jgi:DNA-directed RNA polymerase subunit RPC12/RpoP